MQDGKVSETLGIQAAQYRQDIRDLTGLTVTKMVHSLGVQLRGSTHRNMVAACGSSWSFGTVWTRRHSNKISQVAKIDVRAL